MDVRAGLSQKTDEAKLSIFGRRLLRNFTAQVVSMGYRK
jgi:hypothetical protein